MRRRFALLLWALVVWRGALLAEEKISQPFRGVTHIERTETAPRDLLMHIVKIDLTAPGLSFKLTPPGGSLETVRQTALDFLKQECAQITVNGHFFLPFPSTDTNVSLAGFAASNGTVYSAFESPVQSYAIVSNSPALNIDSTNRASIVHRDPGFADGKHVLESVTVWNAVSGSAQIITNGAATIPVYADAGHPRGLLTPGGPSNYTNAHSWYDLLNARTAIGLSQDSRTLFLFTVDARGGSQGMSVSEVSGLLVHDYGVFNALNLDGGGSTTLAMEDPISHRGVIVNASSDNPNGRASGSNLAVFAAAAGAVPSPGP